MFFDVLLDVVQRVLRIAVDPHNLHAVTGKLLAQLLQTRPVKSRQRTLGSQEANDFPLRVGNRYRLTFHVSQFFPNDVNRFGRGTRFGEEQAEQQRGEPT